jgi:hypothetical protein
MVTRLVSISDTHCGSTYGLCPPDFVTLAGNTIGLSPRQQWLWDAWQAMNDDVRKRCPNGYDLIINGDASEFVHHRSTEVISADNEDHIECAKQSLLPLITGARKVYFVEGTDCHTGRGEHYLAKHFNAVPSPHGAAWELLHLRFCDTNVFAAHHLSSTKRAYLEASGLGIEFNDTVLRAAREGYPIPRVGIYAHRHVPSYFGSATGVAVVNGAWQFLTRYGRKYVPGSVTTPSATILDWSQEDSGDDPQVIQLRYTPPAPKY